MSRIVVKPVPAIVAPPTPAPSIEAYTLDLPNARVLVGSDLHAWPGVITTGMRSFLWAAKKLKPYVVCLGQKPYTEHGGSMTRDELLADRTDDPVLTPEQFEMALRLAVAEFKAEELEKRHRRRAQPAKHRDLMSDDTNGADEAELLAGVGKM